MIARGSLVSFFSALIVLQILAYVATVSASASSPKVLGLPFVKKTVPAEKSPSLRRRAQSPSNVFSLPLTNVQDVLYYVNISLGTPAQNLAVQLDTGSSDLWVLSKDASLCMEDTAQACRYGTFQSSTSSSFVEVAPGGFNITYLLGDADVGDFVNDTLRLGDVTLNDTTFGFVTTAAQGDNMGILGVGYVNGESTEENNEASYPNVVQALYDQGFIESRAFSLWLNDLNASTGTILFGGVDTSKYTGSLTAIPIHPDVYTGVIDSYDVPLTSITFRANSSTSPTPDLLAPNVIIPVALDSGSTDIILPDDVVSELYLGLGAISPSSDSGNAIVPCIYGTASTASLDFQFAGPSGPSVSVPISEFVLPLVDHNGNPIADPTTNIALCRLGIRFAGPSRQSVLGDTFLRSAYVVYDIQNDQIAIAQTKFSSSSSSPPSNNDDDSHISPILPLGIIPGVSSTATASPALLTLSTYVAAQTDSAIRHSTESSTTATGSSTGVTATTFPTPTFDLGLTTGSASASATSSSSSSSTAGQSSSGAAAAAINPVPNTQNCHVLFLWGTIAIAVLMAFVV